jgi:membrane protein
VKRRIAQLKAWITVLRGRHAVVDHAARAYDRHSEVLGGQLAAAITYFGFLSFFPLLALGFSIVGYITEIYPGAQAQVTATVQDAFPSLIGSAPGQIDVGDIIDAKRGAGIIGLLGLVVSGLSWLDALRDGLRRIFATSDVAISFLRKKLTDVMVLALLGLALLASVAVSGMATAATTYVLDLAGQEKKLTAVVLLKVLAVAVSFCADVVIFYILLARLSGAHLPWRQVRSGAVLGAVAFELLKLLGTFLVGRTTSNPVYATFGVIVGLLVWMNLVSRVMMFAAAWTATRARRTPSR